MRRCDVRTFRQRRLPARATLLLAFAASSGVNYAFGLAMGWLLPPGDFGLLAFAQTVGLIAGLVLHYAVPPSLAAAIVGAPDQARAALVRGAVVANLALALALGMALLALFALGPLRPGLESWAIAGIVASSLPFVALISVAWGTAQSAERFGILGVIAVAEVICKAVSGLALVAAGAGAEGAIAGLLVGAVFGAALSAHHLTRNLGVGPGGAVQLPALRTTAPILGSMLGLVLLLNLDLVGLKLFAPDDRTLAGYYQAGIILANAPYYLVTSTIVTVLFTQLARLGTLAATGRPLGESLALALTLAIPVEAALALAPGSILALFFPSAYAAGAAALRLLAIGNSLLIAVALLATAFQATGRAATPAAILLVIAAVEPFALRIAVSRWQAAGAAAVFVGASAASLLAMGVAYLRAVGPRSALPAIPWLLRYGAATATGLVVGLAAARLGGGQIIALGAGGTCYLALALAMGLIPGHESLPWGGQRLRGSAVEDQE